MCVFAAPAANFNPCPEAPPSASSRHTAPIQEALTSLAGQKRVADLADAELAKRVRQRDSQALAWIKNQSAGHSDELRIVREWRVVFLIELLTTQSLSKARDLKTVWPRFLKDVWNRSFTPKNRKMIANVFDRTRRLALQRIDMFEISVKLKIALSNRLNQMTLDFSPPMMRDSDVTIGELLSRNIRSDGSKNRLGLGPAIIDQTDDDTLFGLFAQELALNAADALEKTTFQKGPNPFVSVWTCLRDQNSMGAPAYALPLAFADWFAAEILSLKQDLKQVRPDLCASSPEEPSPLLRLEKIYLAHPTLREKLHLKSIKTPKYCAL